MNSELFKFDKCLIIKSHHYENYFFNWIIMLHCFFICN